MQTLQFWFAYPSTYSYLSVARIARLAAARTVRVEWQPFSLQPIFAPRGWERGPFLPFPDKLDYMWRDLERRAALHGIAYKRPAVYPPNTRITTRVGLLAARQGWCPAFTEAVFKLHWVDGCSLGTEDNLNTAIASLGRSPAQVLADAEGPDIDAALSAQTDRAKALKLFGAPSFTVCDELFWGDDRLEDAIEWAATH